MNDNNIADQGVEALAQSKTLTQMEELHLEQDNWIHAQGAKAIAESTALSSLQTLVLGLNRSEMKGRIIWRIQNFTKLAFLNVIGNKLTAAGEDALRYSKTYLN